MNIPIEWLRIIALFTFAALGLYIYFVIKLIYWPKVRIKKHVVKKGQEVDILGHKKIKKRKVKNEKRTK